MRIFASHQCTDCMRASKNALCGCRWGARGTCYVCEFA